MLGALAAISALVTSGCATSRTPFTLKVVAPKFDLTAGREQTVEALLTNTGRTELRFEKEAGLYFDLTCHRPTDRRGRPGFGITSGVVGGVMGGIADGRPDPTDPFACRSFPPRTFAVAPGATHRLALTLPTPGFCAAGPGELELHFEAPDMGRKCPGIWYGKTGPIRRRADVSRAGAPAEPRPPSPAALTCTLRPQAGDPRRLELTLRNPGKTPYRARTLPSLEVVQPDEPYFDYWAPFRLTSPTAPLALDQTEILELPAGGEATWTLPLADLVWGEVSDLWPEGSFTTLRPGRYRAAFHLETLGGKSWEFHCGTALLEVPPRGGS